MYMITWIVMVVPTEVPVRIYYYAAYEDDYEKAKGVGCV